jgi:hypothetical protein
MLEYLDVVLFCIFLLPMGIMIWAGLIWVLHLMWINRGR